MLFTHISLILSLTTSIFLSTAISLRPSSYRSRKTSIFKPTLRMAEGDVELGHVEIDDTLQLLLKYDGVEVPNPSDQHRPGSIFMVPSVYRDLSPHSYTPQVVSIGPLHHQDKNLIGFEAQKAAYMHNLLHRIPRGLNSTPEEILKECLMRVSGSIDRIKACYFGMPQAYTDSELVKMMVTDACFILSFLYERDINYSSLGPIKLLHNDIYRDMVLIENQIPFFVLQDIFDCTFLKLHPTQSLIADFIFPFLEQINIFERNLVMTNSIISSTHDHILGFIHKFYQHPDRNSSTIYGMVQGPSVIELYRSGVRFSKKLDANWPLAMELKFSRFPCFPLSWSKPTLKMPVLKLEDKTESIIRNLIIYEQSSKVQTCVTSYMMALDDLIDTPEDVAKLARSQVLVNYLSSHQRAADVINDVLKHVTVDEFYYQDEWRQMDEYYNAYWPNLIAGLKRRYFNNPWSIIALIAGIVLFGLTVVQTVYAVKAVKDSKAT